MAKTKRFASKRLLEEDNNNGNNDDNLEAGEQKQSKRKSKRQRRALGTLTNNNKSTSNNKQEIQRPYASDGYQYTGSVDDIDAHDKNDPLAVSDYVQALFEYHRKAEQITACSMESQPYITAHMRAALVNWFFVCQEKLQFSPETIYLAVNLVDRYLSKKKVSGKRRLQVIGAASLLIAAKYEEMYYYDLNDIIKECQDECTREEVSIRCCESSKIPTNLTFYSSTLLLLYIYIYSHTGFKYGNENSEKVGTSHYRPNSPSLSRALSQSGTRRQEDCLHVLLFVGRRSP